MDSSIDKIRHARLEDCRESKISFHIGIDRRS